MTERLSTGDTGLDLVAGGGLPAGALIIVAGPPGSGKTILAQQVCFANATSERKASRNRRRRRVTPTRTFPSLVSSCAAMLA